MLDECRRSSTGFSSSFIKFCQLSAYNPSAVHNVDISGSTKMWSLLRYSSR